MREGVGGEDEALSLFRFHLPRFPQKRLILRLRFGRQVSDFVKSLGDL